MLMENGGADTYPVTMLAKFPKQTKTKVTAFSDQLV